jgi:16S rRNA (guanine527-N7)-methyltransferase
MDTARIATLLEPFINHPLSESQLNQISIYIDLLLHWNARINLTAIRKEEEIVTRHFGESLFMASHLFPPSSQTCHPQRSSHFAGSEAAGESKDPYSANSCPLPQGVLPAATASPRVVDIGSGAGFPGIPLKLWCPQIRLILIESNQKKVAFLREVTRALTLTDIDVIPSRAELVVATPNFLKAEVVTLRAVEHFEVTLAQAIKFLAIEGCVAALIGSSQLLNLPTTLQWQTPIPVPNSQTRVLSVGISS